MENEKGTSKKLLFLEPVSKDSDTELLLRKLVQKLEGLGFKIVDEEEDKR